MAESDLTHHFAAAVLESAARRSVPMPVEPGATGPWSGRDLVTFIWTFGVAIDDAFFGLASAPCPANSSSFGVELMVLSNTLGEALERYFRFYDVITDGLRLTIEEQGNRARIVVIATDPSLDPRHLLPEWYVVRLHGLAEWLIGEEIPIEDVTFAHPRSLPMKAYTSTFGDRVQFDQSINAFSFPSRFLHRRIVREVGDLSVLASREYNIGRPVRRAKAWATLIRSSLRGRLYKMEPMPTMEELAREFGVSGQTLRRGLKNEGTSYRQVKADARREVVLDNISDVSMTLSEISVLAGFAETNGLVRAMKSWTGLSPSAFRRVAIESGGEAAGNDAEDAMV